MVTPDQRESESQHLSRELNTPLPTIQRWRAVLLLLGRVATWAVMSPPRAGVAAWSRLRPVQQLVVGFALYAVVGASLLCLPWSRVGSVSLIDNFFNAVSAITTTGLTTVSVSGSYSLLGQVVLLLLFQIGGVGFMTLSSLLILARGKPLTATSISALKAGFSVPHYFVMQHFLIHVVVFTVACEAVGATILAWRFSTLGIEAPVWSAVFHAVSAFGTAGFSLYDASLMPFAGDWVVNLVIGVLCYLGAIGFIVVQDVWYSIKLRERMLTFTSKVILLMTCAIFILGTAWMFLFEPLVRAMPPGERLLASAFQVMTASTTAGFNTVPISAMSTAGIVILLIAMVIGASPSGTGGGIKTTTVSAILGNLVSVLRGRQSVIWLGHEIPMVRVLLAFAASSVYLIGLAIGVLLLCMTDDHDFLPLVFEAVSAIGTVGLSMGITGELSTAGKFIVIGLMFAGRCGPLTIGLALLRADLPAESPRRDDLAV